MDESGRLPLTKEGLLESVEAYIGHKDLALDPEFYIDTLRKLMVNGYGFTRVVQDDDFRFFHCLDEVIREHSEELSVTARDVLGRPSTFKYTPKAKAA